VNIGEVCSREVYIVRAAEPLTDAVTEMHKRHVGAVVVVAEEPGLVRPIGIVTDRDAIRSQVLQGKGLSRLTVADAMTTQPLTLSESSGIPEAIGQMSTRGVRRAPVVNESGDLVGIVSFDDLLPVVSEQLHALAKLIGDQARREEGGRRG
jgi:CBS domain-containing protein